MDYYVYVYIDPRNYEEFYYGKGKGSRKNAHLASASDSEKSARILGIRKEGLEPIIRVIARGLTEAEALLIEKTLLWKLGKNLTNIASGHYAEKFRPHDKLHLELSGFDYQSGVYYYNVGQGPHRTWADFFKYKFISAGGGQKQWRNAMLQFNKGDIIAAYLKGAGYVGIGRILATARPMSYFMGLDFPSSVINHIHQRFGGHPFFIRQLCSQIHNELDLRDQKASPLQHARMLRRTRPRTFRGTSQKYSIISKPFILTSTP